jgi:hypothetical protein
MNVPAECGKFHDQNHLSTGDIDLSINRSQLTVHMGVEHMSHEEDKTNPWHIWSRDSASNNIGTSGTDKQCANTAPKIKNTDDVEERDTACGVRISSR